MLLMGDTYQALDGVPSYYYDATNAQQRNLVLAYEEILKIADGKDVLFVIVPGRHDISQYQTRANRDSYKQQDWYRGLHRLTETDERVVSVLDLMDHLPNDTDSLFLRCDDHWGNKGNVWAADVIHQHVRETGLFE